MDYIPVSINLDEPGWNKTDQRGYYYDPTTSSCAQAEAAFKVLTDAVANATTQAQLIAAIAAIIAATDPAVPGVANGYRAKACGVVTNPTPTITPLLSQAGRTPVLAVAKYRVREAGGRKLDVQLLPATGWQYKTQTSTGQFFTQSSQDWSALNWQDVDASGLFSVNGPPNTGENVAMVLLQRKDSTESYQYEIRTYETFDWRDLFSNTTNGMKNAGAFEMLGCTDQARLNYVIDHEDADHRYFRETVNLQPPNGRMYRWNVGGSPTQIPDGNSSPILKLAKGIYVNVYRVDIPIGTPASTGEQIASRVQPYGANLLGQSDVFTFYTGK